MILLPSAALTTNFPPLNGVFGGAVTIVGVWQTLQPTALNTCSPARTTAVIGPHAGALVAPDTLARAAALGLDLPDHLARHDAYGFFEGLGDLVVTGPTHTNVNDFRALLVL